jgi:hypothetical protein
MWIKHSGEIMGVVVEGDKTTPPTWWIAIKPILIALFWKKVAVLEFPGPTGFRIGYRDFRGDTRFSDKDVGGRIRLLVGHEDVIFFGFTVMGMPILPKLVICTTKDDPDYKDVPLL